jgi:hypothetical protein
MRDSNHFDQGAASPIRKIALTSLTLTTCLLLVSCGSFDAVSIAKKPFTSVAKLIPKRIPIAEVRTEDLKKMPTGAEKALAFQQKRERRRFAFFRGLYKEPKLPDARTLPIDGGVLPPLRGE